MFTITFLGSVPEQINNTVHITRLTGQCGNQLKTNSQFLLLPEIAIKTRPSDQQTNNREREDMLHVHMYMYAYKN